jgi:hypothetical protein
MRIKFIAYTLILILFVIGCAKKDSTSPLNNTPTSDLTRNDCIGCHTSEMALRATVDTAASKMCVNGGNNIANSKIGPNSGNHIAGEG